jgi:hypothetical protein
VGACAKTVQQWTALLAEAAALFNADCLFACERDSRLAWGCAQWDETFHAARTFQRGQRVRVGGALGSHENEMARERTDVYSSRRGCLMILHY